MSTKSVSPESGDTPYFSSVSMHTVSTSAVEHSDSDYFVSPELYASSVIVSIASSLLSSSPSGSTASSSVSPRNGREQNMDSSGSDVWSVRLLPPPTRLTHRVQLLPSPVPGSARSEIQNQNHSFQHSSSSPPFGPFQQQSQHLQHSASTSPLHVQQQQQQPPRQQEEQQTVSASSTCQLLLSPDCSFSQHPSTSSTTIINQHRQQQHHYQHNHQETDITRGSPQSLLSSLCRVAAAPTVRFDLDTVAIQMDPHTAPQSQSQSQSVLQLLGHHNQQQQYHGQHTALNDTNSAGSNGLRSSSSSSRHKRQLSGPYGDQYSQQQQQQQQQPQSARIQTGVSFANGSQYRSDKSIEFAKSMSWARTGSRISIYNPEQPPLMIPAAVAATLEGLPGLDHVLDRQAPSPVCLQSYRSYLSSTEQCADVLDFYLDVSNFVSLCREYCSELLGPGTRVLSTRQMIRELRFGTYSSNRATLSKQSSTSATGGRANRSHGSLDGSQYMDEKSSVGLSGGARGAQQVFDEKHHLAGDEDDDDVLDESDRSYLQSLSPDSGVAQLGCQPCSDSRHRLCVMQNRHHTLLMKAWAASSRGATRQLESHSAITTISRPDLRVVVEYIYHRFIAENATHNLGGLIPPSMRLRIRQMVETDSRDDPGIFVEAAARAKQLLAAETFTRFMYARTFENMGTTHAMVRLGVGLALLLVGFSVMMSLILLDVKPRSWRWIALPIVLLAIVNMAASQVRLCPFMALGVTGRRIYEEQSWVFGPVLHPKIAQLHTRRALITMICSAILSVAIVAVFFAVPGHRL